MKSNMEPRKPSLDDARALLARREFERAKRAFAAAMLGDRYNLAGMLGFAEAFFGLEDFRGAYTVLTETVRRHPDSGEAHTSLGSVLLELEDLAGALRAFEHALRIDATLQRPWVGLGIAYERAGDLENADRAWRNAYRERGPAASTYRGEGDPIRVLQLRSVVGGNVPLDPVFYNGAFQVYTLFIESYDASMQLPTHDIVVNFVGDADLRTRALAKAEEALRATHAPAINLPARVRSTGRADVAERLRAIPGIVTPRMQAICKSTPAGEIDLGWPVLIREPGFHSGLRFLMVDRAAELDAALAVFSSDELLAIEYLETRGADGMFRKYRMLAIDGALYPAHLAISYDWKVHYFSAQHGDAFAREEQSFLADPEAAIGTAAFRALEEAAALLGLDYLGFDFALDVNGNAVIFEANATMRIGTNAAAIEAMRTLIASRVTA
jgi:Flp pilus assembly protein TadD